MLLPSNGQRPHTLLHSLQCTKEPPTAKGYPAPRANSAEVETVLCPTVLLYFLPTSFFFFFNYLKRSSVYLIDFVSLSIYEDVPSRKAEFGLSY